MTIEVQILEDGEWRTHSVHENIAEALDVVRVIGGRVLVTRVSVSPTVFRADPAP